MEKQQQSEFRTKISSSAEAIPNRWIICFITWSCWAQQHVSCDHGRISSIIRKERQLFDNGGNRDGNINVLQQRRLRATKENRRLSAVSELGDKEQEDARIVGGVDADCSKYQAICACYSTDDFFMCGATLVAPNLVWSAAHCAPVCETIRCHLCNRVDVAGETVEEFNIISKWVDPNYGKGTPSNMDDISIFTLDKSSTQVTPAKVNMNLNCPSAQSAVVVTGWGATQMGGLASDALQQVTVNTMSNAECQTHYSPSEISADMLCAGVTGGGKDACQGDSGGPMWCPQSVTSTDAPVLCASVSWGSGCAEAQYPGVYADASHFVDVLKTNFPAIQWTDGCSSSSTASGTNTTSSGSNSGNVNDNAATVPEANTVGGASNGSDTSTYAAPGAVPAAQTGSQPWWSNAQGPNDSSSSAPQANEDSLAGSTTTNVTTASSTNTNPSSGTTTANSSGEAGGTVNPANYVLDPCTGLMVPPNQVCSTPPNGVNPGQRSADDPKDASSLLSSSSSLPATASTTGGSGSDSSTATTVFTQDLCFDEFIRLKKEGTCQNLRFAGRVGRERTLNWIEEMPTLRCKACMFRYCAAQLCNACDDSIQDATDAKAQCQTQE